MMITERQLEAFWQHVTVTKEGSIIGLEKGIEAAMPTEAAFTRYNGMIFIAHPDIPVHFWDGKTMQRLDEASK